MLIEYVLNGKRKEVRDAVGKALIKVRAAREVAYETRDMADQPKVIKAPEVVEAPAVEDIEVDSAGDVWDAAIHAASKIKNLNGTWRKKPGAAAQESAE